MKRQYIDDAVIDLKLSYTANTSLFQVFIQVQASNRK